MWGVRPAAATLGPRAQHATPRLALVGGIGRPARRLVIARISPNVAFRIAAGAARLGALYLATHAIGSFLGWQVMADAETPAATDKSEDDDGDEDDEKKSKSTGNKYLPSAPDDRRLESITKYNVFCPTCVPAEPEAEVKPLPGEIDVEDLEFPDAKRSQLPLALVATMEAEDPGISLATISSSADGSTGVYAEGEDVMDGVNLLAVDLGIVYLRTPTSVEYLQISDEPPPPPAPKEMGFDAKPKDKDKPTNKYEIAGAAESINCQGMSCTVERKFVNQLMANPAQLTRQGNARPYARDDLRGFRLSRVKKGTVPRMLGLRSGDVITGINGQPLNSLDGAMKLYTKLRTASHLSVDLVRNRGGSRQQLRLDISII